MHRESKVLCAALAALSLTACVPFVPYKRPPEGTPLAQREKIYLQKRINLDTLSGAPLGVSRTPKGAVSPSDHPTYLVPDYYSLSGDADAWALYKQGQGYVGWALVAELAGLFSFVEGIQQQATNLGGPLSLGGLAAGFGGAIALAEWGTGNYVVPSADHFNAYLRQDLGLDTDKSLSDAAPGELDGKQNEGRRWRGYGSIGAGLDWKSSYDLMGDFSSPWDSQGDFGELVFLGAGWALPGGETLEIRFDNDSRGEHGLWWGGGTCACRTPYWVMDMDAYNVSLIPGYTFTLARFAHNYRIEGFAGFQVGAGFLFVHGFNDNSGGGDLGDYYLREAVPEGGPLLRLQIPASRWSSESVEIGYRYEKFTDMQVYGAGGDFSGLRSPIETPSGERAMLDFSGPYAALNIEIGRFPWSRSAR